MKNKKIKTKTKRRAEIESVAIVYLMIILIVGTYIMLKAGYADTLLMKLGIL